MRRVVYAGSFDPPTKGHQWMIEQAVELFDEVIVAVGTSPGKEYLFSQEERRELLEKLTGGMGMVRVVIMDGEFLVRFAKGEGAGFLLRGIRSHEDYEFEKVMRYINGDIDGSVKSVFLMPPRGIREVSSSFVKGLVGPEGWEAVVGRYVDEFVLERLKGIK